MIEEEADEYDADTNAEKGIKEKAKKKKKDD